MGARFRVRDRQRVRRLLSAMPDEVNREIDALYRAHAPAILAKARAEVPIRTGGLRNALAFKIMPATKTRPIRLRIGLLTKRIQDKFFYARFLEYGRGAYAKKGKRRGRHIGAIPAGRYDFVRGRTGQFMQQTLGRALRGVLRDALRKASSGAG